MDLLSSLFRVKSWACWPILTSGGVSAAWSDVSEMRVRAEMMVFNSVIVNVSVVVVFYS